MPRNQYLTSSSSKKKTPPNIFYKDSKFEQLDIFEQSKMQFQKMKLNSVDRNIITRGVICPYQLFFRVKQKNEELALIKNF